MSLLYDWFWKLLTILFLPWMVFGCTGAAFERDAVAPSVEFGTHFGSPYGRVSTNAKAKGNMKYAETESVTTDAEGKTVTSSKTKTLDVTDLELGTDASTVRAENVKQIEASAPIYEAAFAMTAEIGHAITGAVSPWGAFSSVVRSISKASAAGDPMTDAEVQAALATAWVKYTESPEFKAKVDSRVEELAKEVAESQSKSPPPTPAPSGGSAADAKTGDGVGAMTPWGPRYPDGSYPDDGA